MAEQNRKTLRSFYCRDYLWELFEVMTRDLGCSMDYLINEAMRHYARSRNYSLANARPQGPGGAPSPPGYPAPSGPPPGPEGQAPYGYGLSGPQASYAGYGPPPGLGSPTGGPPPLGAPAGGPGGLGGPPPPPPGGAYRGYAPPPQGAYGGPPYYGGAPLAHPPPGMPVHPGAGALAHPPPPPPPAMGPPVAPPPQMQQGGYLPQGYGAPPPAPTGPTHAPPPPDYGGPGDGVHGQPALFLIFNGQKYKIDKEKFIIGRGSQMTDLTIRDGNISRKHAAVIFRGGKYYLKDLDSTNGIDYQGSRIDSKKIEEGDVFHICDYELRFTAQA